MRRRQTAIAVVALLAFVVGIAAGRGGDEEDGAGTAAEPTAATPEPQDREAVKELPLTRQVGRLVVLRFAGTSAPGYVRRVLRQGRAAGSIVFRDNLPSAAQAKALGEQLRTGAGPPLVMVDQEGGSIRNLPWLPPQRSQAGQLAAGTVRADAQAAGKALRATGITVTLAPVADVGSVPDAALGSRAFSSSFATASRAIGDAVKGWRAGGVAPTAKHFPGLGGATVNTDDGPATVERTAEQIREEDLAPFKAAIAAGVPLIMAGHARYPALDPDRIASQSPKIIDGLLRGELGYEGVVITDSTEAAAVQAVTDVREAAVRNVRAGVDIVLTTGRGSYIQVYRALLAEARRDPAFRERVRESAARVVALQRSLR